ncbi:MAG: hypothetical protein ACW981_06765 [Candidatus Hodarchaeales archaeon]|jgi:hypothetical protein
MRKKEIIVAFLFLLSILNSFDLGNYLINSVNGEIDPIIYTGEKEVTIDQGSSIILAWIVIDTDPKSYFITNTNNYTGEEVILQSSRKLTNSKISINPVGIPVGENIVTLYVSDYTNSNSSASINVTVIPSPIITSTEPSTSKSTITGTQPTPTSTVSQAAQGFHFYYIFILFSFVLIIKRKRRENEK